MISKLTGVVAAAVIVVTAAYFLVAEIDRRSAPVIEISAPRNNEPIEVEIAGAVATPGVYALRAGDRVGELVEAAGGLLPEADTTGLNQAGLLVDGQRATIPSGAASDSQSPPAASPEPVELLDLNTATIEQLDELPGIGEVRATAIVDFRNQNGPFASVEELLFVDGISEAVLEEIRPYVSVDP